MTAADDELGLAPVCITERDLCRLAAPPAWARRRRWRLWIWQWLFLLPKHYGRLLLQWRRAWPIPAPWRVQWQWLRPAHSPAKGLQAPLTANPNSHPSACWHDPRLVPGEGTQRTSRYFRRLWKGFLISSAPTFCKMPADEAQTMLAFRLVVQSVYEPTYKARSWSAKPRQP